MAKREIHGLYRQTGEWVYLGRCEMTEGEVNKFLSGIGSQFSETDTKNAISTFFVGTTVCNTQDFSAVWVT